MSMVQHQRKTEDKARDSNKKHPASSPVSDSLQGPVMDPGGYGADIVSSLPAEMQIALLMSTGAGERLANLALQLQRSHGNAYVQALFSSRAVQARLAVSRPEEASEREADRAADFVMQKVNRPVQRRKDEEEEEEKVQTRLSQAQRQETPEEEEVQMLNLKGLETRINSARGRGQPLGRSTRAALEPHFGYDFSRVNIHTDAEADSLNHQLNAEAFTSGGDIFFKKGNYEPDSNDGRWLLAHELTHVIQQEAAAPSPDTGITRLQMLRSGRVGRVQYDESPSDIVRIRMPFQIDSFDTILANVNQVIQTGFGSRSRTYTDGDGFQADIRAFLQSLNHPSVTGGGPGMSRQRWLNFSIRLVRSGARIETIEFVSEVQVETPETVEAEAPASAAAGGRRRPTPAAPEGPMSGEWENILSEIEAPEAAGITGTTELPPGEPGTEERGAVPASGPGRETSSGEGAGAYVRGLESFADIASGRWVWNPVLNQMAEWEEQLDVIGRQFQGQPLLGQALLPTVTHLFVILQTIVGTLDLLARLSPPSLVARIGAAGTGLASGITTPEEFSRDMEEVGEQALDIVTLGLRAAAEHLRQGVQELNVFRIIQGIDEVILAILALLGIFRGLRAARARLRARRSAAPAERPGATRTGETDAIETGETSRPAEPAEASARPGRAEGHPEGAVAGPRVARVIRTVEEARRVVAEYRRGGLNYFALDQRLMDWSWRTDGGRGAAPLAYIDRRGRLMFNEARWGSSGPEPRGGGSRTAGRGRAGETGEALRPTEPGEALRPTEPGEAFRPTEPGQAPRSGETARPLSAREAPPGNFHGLSIEYIIEDIAEVRRLRDDIMRGGRPGRCAHGSPEFIQGEWEGFGGRGPAPPAWWQNDGVLRINRERVGWASPDVQAAYARRLAADARPRAGAQPVIQLGVQVVLEDAEIVRRMMQDPQQARMGIDRRRSRQAMQQAWERLGEQGEAPIAFIDTEGVLVVNMEALQAPVPGR